MIGIQQLKPNIETHQNSTRVKAPANTLPEIHAMPCTPRTNEGASSNPKGRESSENDCEKGTHWDRGGQRFESGTGKSLSAIIPANPSLRKDQSPPADEVQPMESHMTDCQVAGREPNQHPPGVGNINVEYSRLRRLY